MQSVIRTVGLLRFDDPAGTTGLPVQLANEIYPLQPPLSPMYIQVQYINPCAALRLHRSSGANRRCAMWESTAVL